MIPETIVRKIIGPMSAFKALIMMGFAKGISDNSSETVAAAQNSAKAVSEEFEKNLDIDPENIDLFGGQEPPVIKPVVDLSEVDKAKEAINGLGVSPNLTAEAARAEALRSVYSVTAPESQRQNDSDSLDRKSVV